MLNMVLKCLILCTGGTCSSDVVLELLILCFWDVCCSVYGPVKAILCTGGIFCHVDGLIIVGFHYIVVILWLSGLVMMKFE